MSNFINYDTVRAQLLLCMCGDNPAITVDPSRYGRTREAIVCHTCGVQVSHPEIKEAAKYWNKMNYIPTPTPEEQQAPLDPVHESLKLVQDGMKLAERFVTAFEKLVREEVNHIPDE